MVYDLNLQWLIICGSSSDYKDSKHGRDDHLIRLFFYSNKKWIGVDTQELYNFTVWVAQSPRTIEDEAVKGTEKFLSAHLVNLDE